MVTYIESCQIESPIGNIEVRSVLHDGGFSISGDRKFLANILFGPICGLGRAHPDFRVIQICANHINPYIEPYVVEHELGEILYDQDESLKAIA